jgi:hypothetical protein
MHLSDLQICSLDTPQEECEHLCRSNQIKKLCKCAPITFLKSHASDIYPNCTIERYEICYKDLKKEDLCTVDCVPSCSKWFLEFEISSTTYGESPVTYLTLSLNNFDYLTLTESYTWTFKTFIGALGGAIGIWFGLDFAVLIEFVFAPFMILIRRLLSKKGLKIL